MLKEVKHLVDMGVSVIPLHEKSKRPIGDDWSNKPTLTEGQLEAKFRNGMNLGVRPGEWSKIGNLYLHVIDVDIRVPELADEAFAALDDLFEGYDVRSFPTIASGSGGASRHIWFGCSEPFRKKSLAKSGERFVGEDGHKHWTWEIDLFGTNTQLVIPPSIHETGYPYHWTKPLKRPEDLPRVSVRDIVRLLPEETEPSETDRVGLTIDEAAAYVKKFAVDPDTWCEDHDNWKRVGMALAHEFKGTDDEKAAFRVWCDFARDSEKFKLGEHKFQWDTFGRRADRPVTMRTIIQQSNMYLHEEEKEVNRAAFADIEPPITATADDFDDEEPPITASADDFDDLDAPVPKIGEILIREEGDFVRLGDDRIPAHLLRIPGALQGVVDYYNATALKPQPQFAVQTAIAFGAVVLSRHHRTDWHNYTNLYLLNLADTGAGKEHSKTVGEELLTECGLSDLIGPKGYTSESGLITTLSVKPRHISYSDEFGRYLQAARTGGDANSSTAETAVMEVFGRQKGTLVGKGFAGNKMSAEEINAMQKTVVRPAITLVGMSTPKAFFDALQGADLSSGYLNRLLIVQSPIGDQRRREDAPNAKIPAKVKEWAKYHAWRHGGNEDDGLLMRTNPAHVPPPPIVVPFAKCAQEIKSETQDEVLRLKAKLRPEGLNDVLQRTEEITWRVALIVALSCDSDKVRYEHFKWAKDYVFFYHLRMVDMFRENIGKTEFEEIAQALAKLIKRSGEKGMTMHEIGKKSRPFEKLDSRGQKEVLHRLTTFHEVKFAKIPTKGRSREAYIYVGR